MTQETLEEQTAEMLALLDNSGDGYLVAKQVVALLRQWQERCEASYIPQHIAMELIEMLAPFWQGAGHPNSIWALTKYVTEQNTALQQRVDRMRGALERIAIQNGGTPVAWLNDYARQALADDGAQK